MKSLFRNSKGETAMQYILVVFLGISIIANIYIGNQYYRLKNRPVQTAQPDLSAFMAGQKGMPKTEKQSPEMPAVKTPKMGVSTSEMEKQFAAEKNKLLKKIGEITEKYTLVKKENSELKSAKSNAPAPSNTTDAELKQYADEVRKITRTNLTYYDNYKKEKKQAEQLNNSLKTVESERNELVGKLKNTIEKNKKLSESREQAISERVKTKESEYLYDMAFLAVEAGMFDRAISYFNKYTSLVGEDSSVEYNLGIIYEQAKNDMFSASKHYQRYLELEPNAEDADALKKRMGL